ncbi:MAG TPA: F0F1 ATP synthase subunit C [Deltaproteobacteria bacterium]|nr:F0F1 ATP synthase subunit C [Deltaproteobacteria bacterium]
MKKILAVLTGLVSPALLSAAAFAQEHGAAPAGASGPNAVYAISAALAIAIASFGGAISQARAASVALEGISRNPGAAGKVQTPMIIALALIESLVIYALVIAFLIQGKIA